MKARPIIFGGESVRAILAGTKTQTRRVIIPQPDLEQDARGPEVDAAWQAGFVNVRCPYGVRGDRLWVRETWAHDAGAGANCDGPRCGIRSHCWYRASEKPSVAESFAGAAAWRSPIHMPRWASRLTLEITDVRVQRLQEITTDDAVAEGVGAGIQSDGWSPNALGEGRGAVVIHSEIGRFRRAWDSINGKRASWASNPFVWAITFRRFAATAEEPGA